MRRVFPVLLVTAAILLTACTSVAPMQVHRFETKTPPPAPAES